MSATDSSPLLVETRGEAAHLILNRPEKRNALSLELLHQLEATQNHIAGDRTIRAVIVAAAGPVFCSGHDLGEMTGRDRDEYRELFALCSRVMYQFRRMPQ